MIEELLAPPASVDPAMTRAAPLVTVVHDESCASVQAGAQVAQNDDGVCIRMPTHAMDARVATSVSEHRVLHSVLSTHSVHGGTLFERGSAATPMARMSRPAAWPVVPRLHNLQQRADACKPAPPPDEPAYE
jgi:hypothetical protein